MTGEAKESVEILLSVWCVCLNNERSLTLQKVELSRAVDGAGGEAVAHGRLAGALHMEKRGEINVRNEAKNPPHGTKLFCMGTKS